MRKISRRRHEVSEPRNIIRQDSSMIFQFEWNLQDQCRNFEPASRDSHGDNNASNSAQFVSGRFLRRCRQIAEMYLETCRADELFSGGSGFRRNINVTELRPSARPM